MTNFQKVVLGAFVGAAIAGIAVGVLLRPNPEDEDRPPIIVRGGSLIFESGDTSRPGKPWKNKTGNEWKPDHDKGHWVGLYGVTFEGGSGACAPVYTPQLTVYFAAEGTGVETAFLITRQGRNPSGNDKKLEPVVVGPNLSESNGIPNPTLTFSPNGKIARADFNSGPQTAASCVAPTRIFVNIER